MTAIPESVYARFIQIFAEAEEGRRVAIDKALTEDPGLHKGYVQTDDFTHVVNHSAYAMCGVGKADLQAANDEEVTCPQCREWLYGDAE
ncbi:hypothetical protein [Streptomyces griseoviridis]|uniref:hypothetical protein n=1 Tax=Streptomyces griseoviridis TaxID=45398 RepID=UPI003453B620